MPAAFVTAAVGSPNQPHPLLVRHIGVRGPTAGLGGGLSLDPPSPRGAPLHRWLQRHPPGRGGKAESRGAAAGEVKEERWGNSLGIRAGKASVTGGDFFFFPVSLRVSPRLFALLMVERC